MLCSAKLEMKTDELQTEIQKNNLKIFAHMSDLSELTCNRF